MNRISIRFSGKQEVRGAWDEEDKRWRFSVADVIAVLTGSRNTGKRWSVMKTRQRNMSKGGFDKARFDYDLQGGGGGSKQTQDHQGKAVS